MQKRHLYCTWFLWSKAAARRFIRISMKAFEEKEQVSVALLFLILSNVLKGAQ